MFYVYEHIRPDTKTVFYVGKGTGHRHTATRYRNKHWENIVNKAGGFIANKIIENVDDELALLAEQERIDQLRKLGVKLCNQTDGGDGTAGLRHTPEARAKIGVRHSQESYNRGAEKRKLLYPFTEEHRKNMSNSKVGEKNTMFGKTHSQEAREKIRESRLNAPRLTCPFCDRVGDSSNMKRWHFDKCKHKGI